MEICLLLTSYTRNINKSSPGTRRIWHLNLVSLLVFACHRLPDRDFQYQRLDNEDAFPCHFHISPSVFKGTTQPVRTLTIRLTDSKAQRGYGREGKNQCASKLPHFPQWFGVGWSDKTQTAAGTGSLGHHFFELMDVPPQPFLNFSCQSVFLSPWVSCFLFKMTL